PTARRRARVDRRAAQEDPAGTPDSRAWGSTAADRRTDAPPRASTRSPSSGDSPPAREGRGLKTCLRNDLDAVDHIALENPVDDVDAVEDLGEDRVLMIEARVVDQIDEDLRIARIVAARGDADGAADGRSRADFVPHERRVADVFVRAGAAALNDEVRHDAVKREAVVVAGFGEPREPQHGRGRLRREQRKLERADAADR